MMRHLLTAAILAATLSAGSSVWAQGARIVNSEPTAQVLSRYGLEIAWTGQAVLNPARDTVAHLGMDEDLIFVQATSGVLTAFDSESGQQRWAVQLGRYDEPTFPTVTNEDVVLAVVGTSMYGIDKRLGGIMWSLRLPGPPSTGPSVDENQVYVGTLDGSVYAFSLRKIRALYLDRRLPEWSYDALVWRYQAAKEVTSPPISAGRNVTFASRDGSLYAVSTSRRELTYQFETDAPIVAPMARVGEVQFLASEDYNFYAINGNNGRVLWEFVTGLPIRKAPYAIGPNLFLTPDRGGLFCLEVATGQLRWWQPRLTNFVGMTQTMVFARDEDQNLVIVDLKDGRFVGRIPARRYGLHVANDRNNRVYLGTTTGRVMALREIGQDMPIYHKYPERLPILPEFAPEDETPEPPAAGIEGE
jgi:outer membrane protein assembly factor BamB